MLRQKNIRDNLKGGLGWRLNRQTDSGRTFSSYNTHGGGARPRMLIYVCVSGSLSVCLRITVFAVCCSPTVHMSMFINNAGVGLGLGFGLENKERSKGDQRHC